MITEKPDGPVRHEWDTERVEKTARRSPEHPERIVERQERTPHIARCGFEIVGATLRKSASTDLENAADEQEHNHVMTSLVSTLEPGQKITFSYQGGGRMPLRWRIFGEVSSLESPKLATAGMRNVQHALKTVLESRKRMYRFRSLPKRECSAVGAEAWIGSILPQGTHVKCARTAVGFTDQGALLEQTDSCVILPHYVHERAKAFNSIVKLLVAGSTPMRVSITLETFRLSREDEAAIQAAQDVVLDRTRDSDLPAHLENSAAAWLKAQAGCRLSCAVSSPSPISESLLKMLAREIYHGAVDVHCDRAKAASVREDDPTTALLDLRSCFPASAPLPPLLPQPEMLVRYGMRRFFNIERPTLPGAGVMMGYVRDGESEQTVRLCSKERGRHAYILGATGTGKSTLLFNLVMQDIQRGEGVCLIDPHGDLYNQVRSSIPSERAGDVVLLDPCDRDRAVGINLLECAGPHREMQVNFVTNEIYAILEKLYDMKLCGGPMFEQYFRGALGLILADPANVSTLVDLSAVFEHKAYRDALLKQCGPSLLTDFWRMAERTGGEAQLANIAPYVVSKLNLFVHNALIRPIIGQTKSTIDFRQIMDKRRILLVNLSRGALGELDMRLLGMVVLTKIMCAAMSRLNMAASRRKPFMLYVDEVQNFTTDATSSLLSESRKFGLCLTLANQNLSQLSGGSKGQDSIIHAILGNVGNMVLFRLGAPDAERLSMYTKPTFSAADLASLPNFHACARILTAKGPTEPFVFQTSPATRRAPDRDAKVRIRKMYRSYSTSIKTVEDEIRNRRAAIREIGAKPEEKKQPESKLSAVVKDILG